MFGKGLPLFGDTDRKITSTQLKTASTPSGFLKPTHEVYPLVTSGLTGSRGIINPADSFHDEFRIAHDGFRDGTLLGDLF